MAVIVTSIPKVTRMERDEVVAQTEVALSLTDSHLLFMFGIVWVCSIPHVVAHTHTLVLLELMLLTIHVSNNLPSICMFCAAQQRISTHTLSLSVRATRTHNYSLSLSLSLDRG